MSAIQPPTAADAVISAKGLTKRYGKHTAVNGIDLQIPAGRIVGLIGPNGSGKTTTLQALLGLIPCDGALQVLGLDPRTQRDQLMQDVSFIADVAVLPRWLKVSQALDFVEGVHPRFSRQKAERMIAATRLRPNMRVREMSKGMVAQLHLALVMAIDARLLVLDEPTLGLDIVVRKQFFQQLLEDYFDQDKTILISTHQVEEIEHVLTDVIFIQEGRVTLNASMEDLATRYLELAVLPEHLAEATALRPLAQRQVFGKTLMTFEDVPHAQLAALGEVRSVALADIFVAKMQGGAQ
ncbi:MAG: multidrug ABC transporter ATP-binding protein [Burkholderiales bacterium PBB3]|nr:MAG: multidrug ABC transporter ATP-binding protein [Burkholderiales bacterium PBB3]